MRRLPELTHRGLRPPGLPGFAGRRGRRSRWAHRGPAGHRRGGRGPTALARWWPSATASGATSWSGAALADARGLRRHRGLRTPDALAGIPPPAGDGAAAQGWPRDVRGPGVEVEHFFSRMVSPEAWARLTERPGRPGGRWPGADGRPAQLPVHGARLRRHRARRARRLRDGRRGYGPAPSAERGMAGGKRARGRRSSRSRGRSTGRTSPILTTSPRHDAAGGAEGGRRESRPRRTGQAAVGVSRTGSARARGGVG